MSWLDWHRPSEFEPHLDDVRALEMLSDIKCVFQLNPRGFVYGVRSGHQFSDAHVDALLMLPHFMSLVLFRFPDRESLFSHDGFERLSQHKRFRAFMDQGNPQITDGLAKLLVKAPHVRWVLVPNCGLTDAAIPTLASSNHLFSLSLISNQISDDSIDGLCRMTRLRRLFLRDTKISESGFNKIKASLPKCRTINWG